MQRQHTPVITPENERAILEAFADGFLPLARIAERHNLSFDQLLDWLETPRIALLLSRLRRAARRRADIVAAEKRSRAICTLDVIIGAYEFDERNTLPARDPESLNLRCRLRDNAWRACATLIRAGAPAPRRARATAARHASIANPMVNDPMRQVLPAQPVSRARAREARTPAPVRPLRNIPLDIHPPPSQATSANPGDLTPVQRLRAAAGACRPFAREHHSSPSHSPSRSGNGLPQSTRNSACAHQFTPLTISAPPMASSGPADRPP